MYSGCSVRESQHLIPSTKLWTSQEAEVDVVWSKDGQTLTMLTQPTRSGDGIPLLKKLKLMELDVVSEGKGIPYVTVDRVSLGQS